MDLEVKIKEEPAWFEGTTSASLEHIEHVSEVINVKEEIKSELTEPWSTQENSLEPSEDTKEEIFIEEHTDDQLLPYIKEETKSRPEVSYRDHQHPDGRSHLKSHKDDRPFKCDHCGKVFGSRSSLLEHLRMHPL
ncbi:zinc finger protein 3 homolog [Anabrus simplex]|uniref:zinc finger protein 3 homolog n=1 Tax=Anabrus simplex TaxID=316456 RepID=UPI0035A3858D